MLNYEYNRFLGYALMALFLVSLMAILAFFFAPHVLTRDKLAPYECGFHPFENARKEFNVHFYLVALLFVAFDLEILVLVPSVLNLPSLNAGAYGAVLLFLLIILGGFVYEWKQGALDW